MLQRLPATHSSKLAVTSAFAMVLATSAGSASAAAPVGQITEFSAGLGAGSHLETIAPGPDGNLWFTNAGTTDAMGGSPPPGRSPSSAPGSTRAPTRRGSPRAPTATSGSPIRYYRRDRADHPHPDDHRVQRGPSHGQRPDWDCAGLRRQPLVRRLGRRCDRQGHDRGRDREFNGGLTMTPPLLDRAGPRRQPLVHRWGHPGDRADRAEYPERAEFSTGLNPGSFPRWIAPGPDGNLWFTDRGTTPAMGGSPPSPR